MLLRSVIVTGDGSGPDVRLVADFSVAQISQMTGLRSGAKPRVLQLDEVAYVRAHSDTVAGPQSREGTDLRVHVDFRIGDRSEGSNLNPIGKLGIVDDGAGADPAVVPDLGFSQNLRERPYDRVCSDSYRTVDGD